MTLREIKNIIIQTKKKKVKAYKEKIKPINTEKQRNENYERAMKGV